MLKSLLGWMNPWKYGMIGVIIVGLISWHYGGLYFAKKEGKAEQKQETIDAINVVINKQEKLNEKANKDIDNSNIGDLRAGLLKQSRPSSSPIPAKPSPYQIQYRSSRSDGRRNDTSCSEAQQSVADTFKYLCRSSGCETNCSTISFDAEFGVVGDCQP